MINDKKNSAFLTCLQSSSAESRWKGSVTLDKSDRFPLSLFLIASHTLIGAIYHSLQPRGILWKFSWLRVNEHLILLTTQHPLLKLSHPSLTHRHTHSWPGCCHTPGISVSAAPLQMRKGMLKDRQQGWLLGLSIFHSPWIFVTVTTTLLPIYHTLHPLSRQL